VSESRVEGEVRGFAHQGEDSAFAVVYLRLSTGEEVTAVGPLGHLVPGQNVVLSGRWQDHPAYGRQFRTESFLVDDPKTLEGLRAYLSSGSVKGVGPELARRLVDRFGLDTLRVLEEEPGRMLEVPGIGTATLQRIQEAYTSDRAGREFLASLRGLGVPSALSRRILDRYGDESLALVARNPYRLAWDVRGVGFRTADAIARGNGFGRDHPLRAEAALQHVLIEAENDGHCYLPETELFEAGAKLEVPSPVLRSALSRLLSTGHLYRRESLVPGSAAIQSASMAAAERAVARRVAELAARTPPSSFISAEDAERATGLTLNADQRRAVIQGLTQSTCIITGGPGTGKTTIVRVLLAAWRIRGETWKLAAPTGRAARRMTEATGVEAATIHRLLEFTFPEMRFRRNATNPLECHGILVDEASMLDIHLARSLVEALPPGGRLVVVGDDHQLPSVGPGQVLHDLIASGVVPVVRLHEIYRQEEGSAIIQNAHRVDRGEMPVSAEKEAGARKDFFIVERDDPLEMQATLLDIVTRRLPVHGFDPRSDVQVLVPVHRGDLGTQVLNHRLQTVLNPGPAVEHEGRSPLFRFRSGDRVIQVRNNYEIEIFNGEIGRVLDVATDAMTVDFDGRIVALAGDQLDEVELAYAITVHKSQGSEYPAVVVVLHRSQTHMLRRNLFYTALTRARRFCCVIADRGAIRLAVAVSGRGDRYTMLADLLRQEAGTG
jgi:exodeoxyribonuclease V alpha subunit